MSKTPILSPIERTIISTTSALYDNQINALISKEELRDLFSEGQLMSKSWLLQHVSGLTNIQNIIVCGGWFGFLARALWEQNNSLNVTSIDTNPIATTVAGHILYNKGSALLADMNQIDYSSFDCVVNTSLEHIASTKAWLELIPSQTTVVVQSNDAFYIKDHVNCHKSVEELVEELSLQKILFAGALPFPMYKRLMVIGVK